MVANLELARQAMDRVRARLLAPAPDSIGDCLEDLDIALDALRALVRSLEARRATEAERAAVAKDVALLVEEAKQASALLKQAADYYAEWFEAWKSGRASYAPGGDGGESGPTPGGALSVEG